MFVHKYDKMFAKITLRLFLYRSGVAATRLSVLATPTNIGDVRHVV